MRSQFSPINPCQLLFFLTFVFLMIHIEALEANKKAYIVYMGDKPSDPISMSNRHINMLHEVVGSDASKHLLHSYHKSFNGFVAKLTEEEAQKLAEMEGIVSVFPSRKSKLHTTRSWDFLGLPLTVKRSTIESDVIVGVMDTGIWPESESFSGKGYGPPPSKWKGTCQGSNITCNNKLIGARYFRLNGDLPPNEPRSALDSEGHGTHTASTAVGNVVKMASLYGLAQGTARGGVPSARIAVYKTCWSDGCDDHNILAAFDAAIADGVDIISTSLGDAYAKEYFSEAHSIGSYHAMKRGILTSVSAGNNGPYLSTLSSVSPWSLLVAATSTDRKFVTKVQLGNNKVLTGNSINTFKLNHMYPLIYSGDAPNKSAGYDGFGSRSCMPGTLDENLVKGKIVLCEGTKEGSGELSAGAVGSVLQLSFRVDVLEPYPLPVAFLESDNINITNYIKSSRNPTAIIKPTTVAKDTSPPYVASFSSRGPNPISKTILKPDIAAPGVAILAAWTALKPVPTTKGDNRINSFNIISGTSMSCPHVTGVAAYIKSFHPNWSPAAIKSAIMTTATPMSSTIEPHAELAYGSGLINPVKALDPGLVYDANETDYIKFLCGEGYTDKNLRLVTGDNTIGCSNLKKGGSSELNYPSFIVSVLRHELRVAVFNRTVTNVGSPTSTYKAKITVSDPAILAYEVDPKVLKFKSIGEKLSFSVSIAVQVLAGPGPVFSASLVWDDGVHQVRSPIVVHVPS